MLRHACLSFLVLYLAGGSLHAQATLQVRLQNGQGEPLADTQLRLESASGNKLATQRTDGQGKARFTELAKGQGYRLAVLDAKGQVRTQQQVEIPKRPGQLSLDLNLRLSQSEGSSTGRRAAPEGTARLNVTVTDMQGSPLSNQRIDFDAPKGGPHYSGTTDAKGRFSLEVAKGHVYRVAYYSPTGLERFDPIEVPDRPGQMQMQYTLQMERSLAFSGKRITLENVYFETDKAKLRPESKPALAKLVQFLKGRPDTRVEIAGHTDSRASRGYNQQLSQQRAEAVRAYCIERGIDPDRMVAKGYGESEPVATNETKAGRAQNRRTEVRILSQ